MAERISPAVVYPASEVGSCSPVPTWNLHHRSANRCQRQRGCQRSYRRRTVWDEPGRSIFLFTRVWSYGSWSLSVAWQMRASLLASAQVALLWLERPAVALSDGGGTERQSNPAVVRRLKANCGS